MSIHLLEVQKKALTEAKGKPGFAYFMEMGLGKTLVAFAEFMELVAEKEVTRLVVVCPNSFKGGWRDEAAKWKLVVDLHVYDSGADFDNSAFLRKKFSKPPVLVVNYEAIRGQKCQAYIGGFIANRDCMIVFDESIQLKTYKSLQTKAALLLAKEFKYRRILSGKPMTQGPHDLWGQLRAINATNMNFFAFRGTFCRMGGYMGKKIVGAQNQELLASLTVDKTFWATKTQWTDLPPKLYSHREYEMTPHMRQMYKQMEREFVLWLESGDEVTVEMAITKYIKLAQISCGFIIKEDGKVEELVPHDRNPRVLLLKEIVEEEATGKVLIAYHHRHVLKILMDVFAESQPAFIKGGMTEPEVRAQKDLFNNSPECRVGLLQIGASKYGHTLLGGPETENRCSTMVFFQNTYSLDDRSQIEDRIHRHGQTSDNCLYLDLFGTRLDRMVNNALQMKEDIYQSVFKAFRASQLADATS